MWLQDIARARGLVVGAFGIQAAMIGSLFCYGVFVPIIEAELGWSRTWLSACSTVVLLLMGGLAFPAGALVDRFGPVGLLRLSAVLMGLGLCSLGLATEPWQLMLGFSVLAGLALSVHDVGTLSPVAKQFPANRGAMTGIVKTGTALGQTLLPALAAALVLSLGWRDAAVSLGVLAFVVVLLAAQAMASTTQRPAPATGETSSAAVGFSLAQARRTRVLWTFCAIQFCFFPAMMTVPVHLVSHAQELGLGVQESAWTLSMIGACSAAGRLIVGFMFDRLGPKGVLLLCLSVLVLALTALRFIEVPTHLYAFAAVYGFAHGGLFTAVSPSVAFVFGMRAHAALFGIILMSGTLSGALVQFLAGVWHDSDGDYNRAFSVIVGMAGLAWLLALSLPRGRASQSETA